jgi:hypothetical protein
VATTCEQGNERFGFLNSLKGRDLFEQLNEYYLHTKNTAHWSRSIVMSFYVCKFLPVFFSHLVSRKDIATSYVCDYRRGFEMNIGFIEHFITQLVIK